MKNFAVIGPALQWQWSIRATQWPSNLFGLGGCLLHSSSTPKLLREFWLLRNLKFVLVKHLSRARPWWGYFLLQGGNEKKLDQSSLSLDVTRSWKEWIYFERPWLWNFSLSSMKSQGMRRKIISKIYQSKTISFDFFRRGFKISIYFFIIGTFRPSVAHVGDPLLRLLVKR